MKLLLHILATVLYRNIICVCCVFFQSISVSMVSVTAVIDDILGLLMDIDLDITFNNGNAYSDVQMIL
jgi:hypothetical protein